MREKDETVGEKEKCLCPGATPVNEHVQWCPCYVEKHPYHGLGKPTERMGPREKAARAQAHAHPKSAIEEIQDIEDARGIDCLNKAVRDADNDADERYALLNSAEQAIGELTRTNLQKTRDRYGRIGAAIECLLDAFDEVEKCMKFENESEL